jgi:hypothetical protein
MVPSQGLTDLIAQIIFVKAFVLAEQIAIPVVFLHDVDDLFVGDGGLLKIIVHVVELRVAAVDIG